MVAMVETCRLASRLGVAGDQARSRSARRCRSACGGLVGDVLAFDRGFDFRRRAEDELGGRIGAGPLGDDLGRVQIPHHAVVFRQIFLHCAGRAAARRTCAATRRRSSPLAIFLATHLAGTCSVAMTLSRVSETSGGATFASSMARVQHGAVHGGGQRQSSAMMRRDTTSRPDGGSTHAAMDVVVGDQLLVVAVGLRRRSRRSASRASCGAEGRRSAAVAKLARGQRLQIVVGLGDAPLGGAVDVVLRLRLAPCGKAGSGP